MTHECTIRTDDHEGEVALGNHHSRSLGDVYDSFYEPACFILPEHRGQFCAPSGTAGGTDEFMIALVAHDAAAHRFHRIADRDCRCLSYIRDRPNEQAANFSERLAVAAGWRSAPE